MPPGEPLLILQLSTSGLSQPCGPPFLYQVSFCVFPHRKLPEARGQVHSVIRSGTRSHSVGGSEQVHSFPLNKVMRSVSLLSRRRGSSFCPVMIHLGGDGSSASANRRVSGEVSGVHTTVFFFGGIGIKPRTLHTGSFYHGDTGVVVHICNPSPWVNCYKSRASLG